MEDVTKCAPMRLRYKVKKYFAIEWNEQYWGSHETAKIITADDVKNGLFGYWIDVKVTEIQPHCGHPTDAIDPAGFCRMCEAEAECSEP